MADEWLENIFGARRNYRSDDFAGLYRTNLNVYGMSTDDTTQECATLARLIYGLSSAYLLTGSERYYLAAKAGVEYQREAFRILSHDGKYCFWAYGRRQKDGGSIFLEPSENADDKGTYALYEQIYALAGMAQFYRISLDHEILEDMRRTVNAFQAFYLDSKGNGNDKPFPGLRGFFSHLDYATMRPDTDYLASNKLRKNWNSIGDHIPAYLINLLAALDPLPEGRNLDGVRELHDLCLWMIEETSDLIVTHFPDPDPSVPYVNERFYADWTPDHDWNWQKNRAIVGHNLKIAWNLTRCANFFLMKKRQYEIKEDEEGAAKFDQRAQKCMRLATQLADRLAEVGVDQVRSGLFDAVERKPTNGMPLQFSWSNTKDFWQQEQGILAYLILHGRDARELKYLTLARELEAFWNLFFLDRDRRGIYFRVNADGTPVVEGSYANKGGHSVAGYHSFELNYLAHLYTRAYVSGQSKTDNRFCLYFRPSAECGQRSINVLPDFFPPGSVRISRISVNSISRQNFDPDNFQIPLSEAELGGSLVVEFCTCKTEEKTDWSTASPSAATTESEPLGSMRSRSTHSA
jgi:mannose/cellobiose epimerase-like protein (N-acyl-D-glucosamine 2-epimerase family)